MSRTILHLDLDAFFCAVEELSNPSLRGKAFAVGGRPDQRGVVASCSYPARRFGVRSAMPMSRAVRLCPDLIIVSSSFGDYREASRKVMNILHDLTPFVEQISIDEAFLDVTMLRQPGEDVARRLQTRIRDELGLPCSIGVASNKLVAKIANNCGKARVKSNAPPRAIEVVPAGQEAAYLAPLPVNELWGIGPKTAESLHKLGIYTIGDLAAWSADDLAARFGKHGEDIVRRAQGIDTRPVETEHEAKSISKETTFAQDINDRDTLLRTLRRLSEGVGRRLRRDNLGGSTVKIKLRWADFSTVTRQTTLPYPTDQDAVIYDEAVKLFDSLWRGRAVRLLGVGLSSLDENPVEQLGLWDSDQTKATRHLQSTLDDLRERFGDNAVQRGSDLKDDD